jgi:hypothetical protein
LRRAVTSRMPAEGVAETIAPPSRNTRLAMPASCPRRGQPPRDGKQHRDGDDRDGQPRGDEPKSSPGRPKGRRHERERRAGLDEFEQTRSLCQGIAEERQPVRRQDAEERPRG